MLFILLHPRKLGRLIEVQTSVFTQWHVGPQPDFFSGSIPFSSSSFLSSSLVSGNDHSLSLCYL
jgi:hypothetical protein